VIPTAATLGDSFLEEVASSAPVVFQSQLASVNMTSVENRNMLARFEGALLGAAFGRNQIRIPLSL